MNDSPTLTGAVADRVRDELRTQGRSVISVAHALGVSEMYVSRRLNGHVALSLLDLQRIADELGVPVSTFLDVAREPQAGSGPTHPTPTHPTPSRPTPTSPPTKAQRGATPQPASAS